MRIARYEVLLRPTPLAWELQPVAAERIQREAWSVSRHVLRRDAERTVRYLVVNGPVTLTEPYVHKIGEPLPDTNPKQEHHPMTNPNKSHITIVADRSGSMASMKTDAEGGINTFIQDQAAQPGDCSLYFVEFDTAGHDIVHDGPIGDCPTYTLRPRGGTPLLDAIGRAINETGIRLAALPEDDRPGHVFFVVQTDGEENSSREFTLDQIRSMISQQETEWSWTFVFLATGPDAFGQSQMFVGTQMVANTFRHDADTVYAAYTATSANIARTRAGAQGVSYGGDVRTDTDTEE